MLALALAACGAAAATSGASAKPMAKAGWLHEVTVTEYYPVPEAWFVGKKVAAPGIPGKHRIDWLYSATGLSMEGDGIGLDGRAYHIDALGKGGWVNAAGRRTAPGKKRWSRGSPVWRAGGYYLTKGHDLTFPLDGGGWAAGGGVRYVPLKGVSFATGHSLALRYYRSLAVDPSVIPLGSRVYIDAYKDTAGGGWFVAQDTGGAIQGRHVDVYRKPPDAPDAGGGLLDGVRVYVIPPGARAGRGAPAAAGSPTASGGSPSSSGGGPSTSGGGAAAP